MNNEESAGALRWANEWRRGQSTPPYDTYNYGWMHVPKVKISNRNFLSVPPKLEVKLQCNHVNAHKHNEGKDAKEAMRKWASPDYILPGHDHEHVPRPPKKQAPSKSPEPEKPRGIA